MPNGDPKIKQKDEQSESNFLIQLGGKALRICVNIYQALNRRISSIGQNKYEYQGLSIEQKRFLELSGKHNLYAKRQELISMNMVKPISYFDQTYNGVSQARPLTEEELIEFKELNAKYEQREKAQVEIDNLTKLGSKNVVGKTFSDL